MKLRLIITLFLIQWLCSCVPTQSTDAVADYTNVIYKPSFAQGFEILSRGDDMSRLIRVSSPWQGASDECFELLILRGSEEAPSGYSGAVVRDSALRIVAFSSTNVAMFDRLGVVDRVVGVSGLNYISNTIVVERGRGGKVRDVGYDSNINFETIAALRPDIVLLYSVAGGNNSITNKLDELSIPYLYVGDYVEQSPLGKAEWMVAMGELVGRRALAESEFASIVERYNALKEVASKVVMKPRVMLNTPYKDSWFMPFNSSYIVRLVSDAGGQYAYTKNDSNISQPISMEEAFGLVDSADYWINLGSANSLAEFKSQNKLFAGSGIVNSGGLYNNTARMSEGGGSEFWESGVVNPDIVLRDLIKIFHPELIQEPLYYYKQLK